MRTLRLHRFLCLFSVMVMSIARGDVQLSTPEVDERLARAREDVALARATEARLQGTLAAMRAEVPMNSNAVAVTEGYLKEVSAMVGLHETRLAELEALVAPGPVEGENEMEKGLRELDRLLDQQESPESGDPLLAALDAELQQALVDFDGMLLGKLDQLKEDMDRVSEATSTAASEHAKAAAEAAALLREMGVDPEVTPPTESQNASAEPEPDKSSVKPGEKGIEPHKPSREQDEDIVARQLREAAEKETDPVLREKLWAEYEAYLEGS